MTLRIKLFTEKMRIAQYADNSIYDYRLKIAQAVLHFPKAAGAVIIRKSVIVISILYLTKQH